MRDAHGPSSMGERPTSRQSNCQTGRTSIVPQSAPGMREAIFHRLLGAVGLDLVVRRQLLLY